MHLSHMDYTNVCVLTVFQSLRHAADHIGLETRNYKELSKQTTKDSEHTQ